MNVNSVCVYGIYVYGGAYVYGDSVRMNGVCVCKWYFCVYMYICVRRCMSM